MRREWASGCDFVLQFPQVIPDGKVKLGFLHARAEGYIVKPPAVIKAQHAEHRQEKAQPDSGRPFYVKRIEIADGDP